MEGGREEGGKERMEGGRQGGTLYCSECLDEFHCVGSGMC